MGYEKEDIDLSLRDFALPVPRTGSIESHSGFGRAALEGQQIHARVQKRRRKSDPCYEAEVTAACRFERGGYVFRVEGRMDGLFRHDPPKIEEIKSGPGIAELARRLADQPLDHPYALQLLTYGYFYWREHGIVPSLSFHLVSTRGGGSRDLELVLDPPRYEIWLEARLDELVREARLAEKRAARRRRIAADLTFPFSTARSGQRELMQEVREGLAAERPMLLQAPTGLGKTVGVLFPVLEEALGRGQRVIYVTPKNSQHAVAEDAVMRFQKRGARIKSLSMTAKGKICFQEEALCSAEFCEYARDHYAKVHAHGLPGLLARKRVLRAATFRELGERYRVCPFELQLEAVREADVVICDYNYVFAPRSALNRVVELGIGRDGRPSLVMDEAHNLPARSMEAYSPCLSSAALDAMRAEIRALATPLRAEAEALLDGCLSTLASCRPQGRAGPARIEPPAAPFAEQDARLRAFLSRYLESGAQIRSRDVILRLCFAWSEFADALETACDPKREEFFTTFHPQPDGALVKITCCDASAMLEECYRGYQQVVAFSATLKPFAYYIGLCGLKADKTRTAEFASPFPAERRKLLVVPQVSTRYSRRERNYAKIAEAVRRMTTLRPGNYFIFLPSFAFLKRVADLFVPPDGFAVLRQERNMTPSAVADIVASLRSQAAPTIVFAVQGGSLAEGVDYAGEAVIGAFVVGPPLPVYALERELMRDFYQRRYGSGFEYAYVIPAMARAVQAAGRVIRSESDRGLIVLMDSRFVEPDYTAAMPADWFDSDVGELVSQRILDDLKDFWTGS